MKVYLYLLMLMMISCKKKPYVPLANVAPKNVPDIEQVSGREIFIRIFKEESELELWTKKGDKFELFKTYPICTWSGTLGPKLKEGDGQSPEGFYFVKKSQLNPNSSYHLSFNIGYPNHYDRSHGRTGSFIMVHGSCVSIGCYAMTDPLIEEIYHLAKSALDEGQDYFRVHIFPFRMNAVNMKKHSTGQWQNFWLNLKEGYDAFENTKIPPNVSSLKGRYLFQ